MTEDEKLMAISDEIGTHAHFDKLGTKLKIPYNSLQAIRTDYQSQGVKTMTRHMLQKWKMEHGFSLETLRTALIQAGLREVATDHCS